MKRLFVTIAAVAMSISMFASCDNKVYEAFDYDQAEELLEFDPKTGQYMLEYCYRDSFDSVNLVYNDCMMLIVDDKAADVFNGILDDEEAGNIESYDQLRIIMASTFVIVYDDNKVYLKLNRE